MSRGEDRQRMQRLMKLAAGAAAIMLVAAGAAQAKAPAHHAGKASAKGGASAATIAGKPNLNGIWQAMGTGYWDLEPHSAAVA